MALESAEDNDGDEGAGAACMVGSVMVGRASDSDVIATLPLRKIESMPVSLLDLQQSTERSAPGDAEEQSRCKSPVELE